ncbi:MAG: hypothetical protein Q7T68_04610 [Sphingopyxis sp.]|nr:hypothetical protein [Sphingopyxis sp.]
MIATALLLPLLTLWLALLIIASRLLAHFATLLALHLRLLALLTLGSCFAAAAAADFGAARSAVPTVAALCDLHPLARCLCGCRGDGGQDRCSNQQPSKHLLHLALLQLMSRTLKASRDDEVILTRRKMIDG